MFSSLFSCLVKGGLEIQSWHRSQSLLATLANATHYKTFFSSPETLYGMFIDIKNILIMYGLYLQKLHMKILDGTNALLKFKKILMYIY